MFKRLFFLSGLIAFLLAALTMWFWYLPNHQVNSDFDKTEMNQPTTESVDVDSTSVE